MPKSHLRKASKVSKATKNTFTDKSSASAHVPSVDFTLDHIMENLPQPDFQQNEFENKAMGGSISRGGNAGGGAGSSSNQKTARKAPAAILPPAEHEKILKRYTEISKASWLQIPVNTYVRYIDKNNMLHQGGKLKCFSRSVSGTSTLMELIVYNHISHKRIVIKIDLDKTVSIWKLNDSNTKSGSVQGGQAVLGGKSKNNSLPMSSGNPAITSTTYSNQADTDNPDIHIEEFSEPNTREDDMLNKLGNKLLFEDGDLLKQKVENLESEVFRLNEEMKKMFILIKRMYRVIEKP